MVLTRLNLPTGFSIVGHNGIETESLLMEGELVEVSWISVVLSISMSGKCNSAQRIPSPEPTTITLARNTPTCEQQCTEPYAAGSKAECSPRTTTSAMPC